MRIKRLKLNNYCQHTNLDLSFNDVGLIGLFGKNGAGKSNTVGAIASGISGAFDRKKDRLITLGQKTGSIELDIEIEPGTTYKITRRLDNSDANLICGDIQISGAETVTQFLLDKLQVDQGILSNVVFVKQNEISEILFAKKERDRMASKFFGLDKAVAIEKELTNKINAISLFPISTPSSEYFAKISDLKIQKEALEIKLQNVPTSKLEELAALNKNISIYFTNTESNKQRDIYNNRRAALIADIDETEQAISRLQSSISSVDIESVRSIFIQEKEKQRLFHLRQGLLAQKLKYHTDQERLGPCQYSDQEIVDLQEEIRNLSIVDAVDSSIAQTRKELHHLLLNTGSATCSVCESSLNSKDSERISRLFMATQEQDDISQRLSSLRTDLDRKTKTVAKWKQSSFSLNDRIVTLEQELKDLGEDRGSGNPEKWEAHIVVYDNMRDDKCRLQTKLQTKQSELESLTPPDVLHTSLPDNFDPAIAVKRAEEIRNLIGSSRDLTESIGLIAKEIEVLTKTMKQTEDLELENSVRSGLKVALSVIREQFHPDGAPKDLVGQRLKRMEQKINECLDILGADFSVRGESGFNFVATFNNRPGDIMASELSGGQKVSLSIAFRIAAITSFSASVGIISMDEPTQALDSEKIENFKLILEKLKTMSEQLGFQFIIITHEDSLKECFDQIIDLSE